MTTLLRPFCWDCAVNGKWHLMTTETHDRFACLYTGLLHVPRADIDWAWDQWKGPGHFGPAPLPKFVAGPFGVNRAWRRHALQNP